MATTDPPIGQLQREVFTLLLDIWELLVEDQGVPGSVGEHLLEAVAEGRRLLAQTDELAATLDATVGAAGETDGPADPPGAGPSPARPTPPPARKRKD